MPDDQQDKARDTSDGEAGTKGKKQVLDLLDAAKPTRGQRRKQQLEDDERRRSALDQAKKNALNLFEAEEKPKKRAAHKVETGSVLPRIGAGSEPPAAGGVVDPLAEALKAGKAPKGGDLADFIKQMAVATSHAHPHKPREKEPEVPVAPAAPAEAGHEAPAEAAPGAAEAPATAEPKVLNLKLPIVLKDLADLMGLRPFLLIKDLMGMEIFARMDSTIDAEAAEKVCQLHGFTIERERREKGAGVHKGETTVVEPPPPLPVVVDEEVMKLRAPIITFMGHVDHGKTSLLDAIREARVAVGEAGGITQHIGAYSVVHNGQPITFIDTPGHAIFTQMRARGANITDIVVLVVAADDGFMPQTDEALNHAKAAGVTIMVAINKIDLRTANIDRVKAQMQERGIPPVEWGGTVEVVPVSAHTKEGIPELLDTMALQAEVLELKADPKGPARAGVIEARLESGRGPTATVIVRTGTLKLGAPFICGAHAGKIRTLIDDHGQAVMVAVPGMPVEIVGFSGLPNVGDEVVQMKSDRDAKRLSEERQEEQRRTKLAAPQRTRLEDLFASMDEGKRKTFRIVLKGDVQGSVEAIASALREIPSDKVDLDLIHLGAGPISDNDVMLASASDAVILGFNIKLESNAVRTAKREGVQVKIYSIVYELIDQVKEAMLGLLEPETRETRLGHAKVLQVFRVKKGKAAGCYVQQGRIDRKAHARVVRDGQVVYDGPIGTLRRFQDDVDEVKAGTECGIRLGDYNEYEESDIIECYQLEKIQQSL